MTQFKITIHCDQFNAISVEDYESKDAALAHYEEILKELRILRFGEVLVNTRNITFLLVQEVVAEPVIEADTIEV